jgi:hypothetical protein
VKDQGLRVFHRFENENTMTDKPNEQLIADKPAVKIEIDAAPKGEWKALGGSDRDQWNERLSDQATKGRRNGQMQGDGTVAIPSAINIIEVWSGLT